MEIVIRRVWRHDGEAAVHYVIARPDGTDRHLIAPDDSALGAVLNAHLEARA